MSSCAIFDSHLVGEVVHGGIKCIKFLQLSRQDIRPCQGDVIQALGPAQQWLVSLREAPHREPPKAKALKVSMIFNANNANALHK